jgi:DNA invertase Pin-like site-specific DNA recombinase
VEGFISRLGRDTREVLSTVHGLADLGVTVIPVKSQTGPITSTMGRPLWAIQALYAEMENNERFESGRTGKYCLPPAGLFTKGLHRLDGLSLLPRPSAERSAANIVSPRRAN